MHRVLLHTLLFADLMYSSRLYRLMNLNVVQSLLLGSAAAVIVFYAFYLALRGRLFIILLALCFSMLVFNQIAVFAGRISIAVNPNVFFQYVWLLACIPFAGFSLAGQRDYVIRCFVGYGTVYCAIYALVSLAQLAGVLPGAVLAAIISSDVERGARVFMYTGLACFTYFYWLVQYRKAATLTNLAFLGLSASASILSLSRVYLLIVFVLTVLFYIRPRPRLVGLVACGILLAGSAFVFSGMMDTSINPFRLFGSDSSGSYRALEYDIVRQFLQLDPVWGFGLSPTSDLSKPLLGPFLIFASDLGVLGVWFDFGLIGLLGFYWILWTCTRPNARLDYELGWPLLMTGCMLAAIGCISPLAVTEGGATFAGVIIGLAHGDRVRRSYKLPLHFPIGGKLARQR